jgi:hypothetical protein
VIPRLTYLKKMLSVCGRREAHLPKESCDFFYANELLGSQELIYLNKFLISYATQLLGIPRPIYLKKI